MIDKTETDRAPFSGGILSALASQFDETAAKAQLLGPIYGQHDIDPADPRAALKLCIKLVEERDGPLIKEPDPERDARVRKADETFRAILKDRLEPLRKSGNRKHVRPRSTEKSAQKVATATGQRRSTIRPAFSRHPDHWLIDELDLDGAALHFSNVLFPLDDAARAGRRVTIVYEKIGPSKFPSKRALKKLEAGAPSQVIRHALVEGGLPKIARLSLPVLPRFKSPGFASCLAKRIAAVGGHAHLFPIHTIPQPLRGEMRNAVSAGEDAIAVFADHADAELAEAWADSFAAMGLERPAVRLDMRAEPTTRFENIPTSPAIVWLGRWAPASLLTFEGEGKAPRRYRNISTTSGGGILCSADVSA